MDIHHSMDDDWKHRTTPDHFGIPKYGREDRQGIDLFDDEREGCVSVYIRFNDGTRMPARDIGGFNSPEHAAEALVCLNAWTEGKSVYDYRTNKEPRPERASEVRDMLCPS